MYLTQRRTGRAHPFVALEINRLNDLYLYNQMLTEYASINRLSFGEYTSVGVKRNDQPYGTLQLVMFLKRIKLCHEKSRVGWF